MRRKTRGREKWKKMAEILLGGKRLSELKVAELKVELEKRGLPKKGVKSVLIGRLKNAILREELTQADDDDVQDGNDTETSIMDTSQSSQDEEAVSATAKKSKEAERVVSNDDSKVEDSKVDETTAVQQQSTTEPETESGAVIGDDGKQGEPEEVTSPLASTPLTEAATDLAPPLQPITPSAAIPSEGDSANEATEQDIDVEGRGTPPIDGEDESLPMDIATPLSPGSDFHLSVGSEQGAEEEPEEQNVPPSSTEAPLAMEEEDLGDIDVVGEEPSQLERLDSVQIDPSYQPESEELLYEGDVEHDAEQQQKEQQQPTVTKSGPVPLMEQDLGPLPESIAAPVVGSTSTTVSGTTGGGGGGQEEGFIVAVHDDTSQDLLDVSTTTRSSSKKDSTSSTTKKKESGSSEKKSDKRRVSTSGDKSKTATSSSLPSSNSKDQSSGSKTGRKVGGTGSPSESAATPARSAQCNLWVSGLVSSVRALDLQTLFSPFGQVVSAKVVAKPHSRSNRFGYVTMATPEQAQTCIRKLSNTELKGRKITVEVAKSQPPLGRQGDHVEETHPSSSSSTTPSKSGEGGVVSSSGSKGGGADRSSGDHGKSDTAKTPTGTRKDSSSGMGKSLSSSDKSRRSSFGKPEPATRRVSEHKTVKSEPRRRSRSRERRPLRRSRTPPPLFRRSPPSSFPRGGRRARSRSPHRVGSAGIGARGPDARQDIVRREMERRMLRERERQVELRLEQRRLAHDRQQELIIRRQLEAEHSRREQEMVRRMQEARDREAREREVRERQLAEQERLFKERERELREKEYRERQRREALERELKERELREKEFRDREKKLKELQEKDAREREMKAQREREARDREARLQAEREKELRERERRLKEEQERIERERHRHEEEQRRLREQAERTRLALQEREETERRERERRLREEKEQKRQDDDSRARREREQKREREEMDKRIHNQSGRLGKRPYQDSASNNMSYDSSKRQSMHGSSSDYSSAGTNVFGRLDPPPSDKRTESAIPPLMSAHHGHGDSLRRSSDHGSGQGFERRSSPGGYNSSRVGYAPGGRDRHTDTGSFSSPLASTSRTLSAVPHQSSSVYSKVASEALQQTLRPKTAADLAHVAPDIINAATQALENIRKSGQMSQGVMGQGVIPKLTPHLRGVTPIQQQLNVATALSAAAAATPRADLYGMGLHQSVPSVGALRQAMASSQVGGMGGGGMSGGQGMPVGRMHHGRGGKLPPEDERYNRRLGRSGGHHHGQGRQGGYKSRM